MRIGATIAIFCMVLSVNLNGQLTADRPGIADATTPERPVKCGFGYRPHLTLIKTLGMFKKPTMHAVYFSPDGAFAVHYDTTARGEVDHSPPLKPAQPDGTPVWVVEVAAALDSARNVLLRLGYDPVPEDDDGIYDVYIQEYNGGTYGNTFPDGVDAEGRSVSYIQIDNDFTAEEGYLTYGLDAARVTCAHEFFHAVQFGYTWRPADLFFYELSSTWIEEIVFPEVNDWVYWFDIGSKSDVFGNNPTQNMARTDGYSIAIFGHYLTYITGIYQPDIMQQAWERFKSSGAVTAIEQSVASYGSNLTTAWTDFVARLFSNGRAPEYYFYADQDSLHAPDPGMAETLVDGLSLPFYNLLPGTAGIQALELAGRPANLCLQVQHEPQDYSGRVVIDMGGDNLILSTLTLDAWYAAGLSSLSKVIVVVGGDRDSVVVTASVADTLTNIAFSLDYLAPNPLVINRSLHRQITLGYTVGKALSQGDHRIIIYNLLGQELYRQRIERTVGEGSQTLYLSTLPFATWPAGIYILRLTLDQRHTFTRTFTLLR